MLPLGNAENCIGIKVDGAEHRFRRNARLLQVEQAAVRKREEGVAGIDGLGFAPHRPQCWPPAPGTVAVFDVVVDEREVVQQLNSCRCWKGLSPIPALGLTRQEQEDRP